MTQHTDETSPGSKPRRHLIDAAQDAAACVTGLATLPVGVVAMGICAIRNNSASGRATQSASEPPTS